VKKPANRQGDTSLRGQFVFRFVAQQLEIQSFGTCVFEYLLPYGVNSLYVRKFGM